MDPLLRRIRSARGHLASIARLLEQDPANLEGVRQLQAVRGALDAIRLRLLRQALTGLSLSSGRSLKPAQARMLYELGSLLRIDSASDD